MAQTNAQETLWRYIAKRRCSQRNTSNRFGPYKITSADIIYRHFDCTNYSACLDVAAIRQWQSFSCKGCRRTRHGTFGEA